MTGNSTIPLKRFARRRPHVGSYEQETAKSALKLKLNTRIREYFNTAPTPSAPAYISHREIPTSEEISVAANDEAEDEVEVPANQVIGPWESKQRYLSDHYALLREDAVTPLRNVVSEMKAEPCVLEKDSVEHSYIYEKVFITGLTFAHGGVAARVTFSLRRAEKKILWEQSKRLAQGTLIALSTAQDMFKTLNPPEIDIFFGSPDEIEIDPQQEWVMVESSIGYFEAYRHTLLSLQKIAAEPFPLAEYIVGVQREVSPPWYLRQQSVKDLSSLFPTTDSRRSLIDLLNEWPDQAVPRGSAPSTTAASLDASQLNAIRRILTKELAIIQGPPGTGKTHVSVLALKVLLQNKRREDPPIIVSAHTNHALDQLLRHVNSFEPEFIRLGGRTTDKEIIEPRTLFNVRQATKLGVVPGGMKGPALNAMRKLVKDMQQLLRPFTEGGPLSETVFKEYGILTDGQCQLLIKGAESWVDLTLPEGITAAISKWAGEELVEANRRTLPEDFGFDYEEMDLEYEQLRELEAEGKLASDEEIDGLRGERIRFNEPLTGPETRHVDFESLLKDDLWKVPAGLRGSLYRYMQQKVKQAVLQKMRALAKVYGKYSKDLAIGKCEHDTNFLQAANIIGCTTTGLSKYRGLLDSLKPKIVLIEEAAETLEAYVTAACLPTLEHLILVGDHQQLRGHCNEPELEGDPFFLDISMFERLVRNQVGFTQLIRQRRMHPEIRRGLMPIYPNLEDHESVRLREPVPGMGNVRSFFFCHQWHENHDQLMSKINNGEASMVVGFFNYLVNNGMKPKDITVLTFYNGQRKLILQALRAHPNLQGETFKVVTVDSYQGEENGVVLLSLVRSNTINTIGFLSVANRVCVALSRAQRGFYIFGDARMLSKASLLWYKLVQAMAENPRRVGFHLPLTCGLHGRTTYATDPHRFDDDAGGCEADCRAVLPCGHACELKCHPFAHDKIICYQHCSRDLACGHYCSEACRAPCNCPCDKRKSKHPLSNPIRLSPPQRQTTAHVSPSHGDTRGRTNIRRSSPPKQQHLSLSKHPSLSLSPPKRPSSQHHPQNLIATTPLAQGFRDFAAGGHRLADAAAVANANDLAAKEHLRRLDEENAAMLFGGGDDGDETAALASRTNDLTLTGTRQARDGGVRNTYRGFFSGTTQQEGEREGGKFVEKSLLD
ncbi:MAG: hypothetical protein Q9173_003471 [Seirophora scorigena]